MDRPRPTLDRALLALIALAGLALRVPGIAGQPLQWDEGWSIALARLPLGEAFRLTALDVHPPLYYAALHAWLPAVGATPLAVRVLSLLAAALAPPLAAAAARAWWPGGAAQRAARRVAGWAAAAAAALAPPLVYYAGVGRMYAPAAVGVLAAAWAVAVWLDVVDRHDREHRDGRDDLTRRDRTRRDRLAFAVAVAGSAAALLSFYYSGFALLGLGLAALVARGGAWRRWWAWVGATAVVAAPWLAFALPQLAARIVARAGRGDVVGAGDAPLSGVLGAAWRAALFVNAGDPLLALVVAGAVGAALGVAALGGAALGGAATEVVPEEAPTTRRAPEDAATAGRAAPSAATIRRSPAGAAAIVRAARGRLAAVVLPIGLVCAAAALGARAHMFAPRYVSVATPFVALGIGWAAAGAVRRPWTAALALAALAAASWPTWTGAIHARSAEWFEAYDPTAVHRAVVELARPGDVVAFNILSQAGAYDSAAASGAAAGAGIVAGPHADAGGEGAAGDESAGPDGGGGDGADDAIVAIPVAGGPAWTYAQLWDPVHEPVKRAIRRVENAYEAVLRGSGGTAALWLALYKGTAAADSAALKAWADDEAFPLAGRWVSDTLVAGYIDAPTPAERALEPPAAFGHGIELRSARHTARVAPGGNVALALKWRAVAPPDVDAHVVVRLVADASGRVVAQREAVPAAEHRPTSTWPVGASVEDRHGLRVPPGVRGRLTIRVGIVDPATGDAGPLGDGVDVGSVEVEAP